MAPPRLTPADLTQAAAALGCELAAVMAVIEVEAGGSGFDAKGRPTVLFEPHIFERELNALGMADDHPIIIQARYAGLCSPVWNKALYGKTADARWAQIEAAIKINQEAALKSASYGIGQVLGQNYKVCGFDSATALLSALCVSEGNQLAAMVNFIIRRGLADELEHRDWAGFARGYNGVSYHLNAYDAKLRKAYEKFAADAGLFWRTKSRGLAATVAHLGGGTTVFG